MPPELVITSTQGNDLSVFERLYKSAQLPRGIFIKHILIYKSLKETYFKSVFKSASEIVRMLLLNE